MKTVHAELSYRIQFYTVSMGHMGEVRRKRRRKELPLRIVTQRIRYGKDEKLFMREKKCKPKITR